MGIIDIIVDFLWLSTEGLGLDFSKMSRRRMVFAVIAWSISDALFMAGGVSFLFQKTTTGLLIGSFLVVMSIFMFAQLAINWRQRKPVGKDSS
jgi:hypothetical protein